MKKPFLPLITFFMVFACNNKNYKPYVMKVGETVIIPGISHQDFGKMKRSSNDNLLLYLSKSSFSLDLNTPFTVEFFLDSDQKEPSRVISSAEFKDASVATHCSQELLSYLREAGPGYALFCNKSLKLNDYNYFKLKIGKKTKDATSTTFNFNNDGDGIVGYGLFFD